jgi:hypothetical protein
MISGLVENVWQVEILSDEGNEPSFDVCACECMSECMCMFLNFHTEAEKYLQKKFLLEAQKFKVILCKMLQ